MADNVAEVVLAVEVVGHGSRGAVCRDVPHGVDSRRALVFAAFRRRGNIHLRGIKVSRGLKF